jgi:hypothetical protein
MLPAFGDESIDESRKRVVAVGSVCGAQSDWKPFNDEWRDRNGGKCFHAAACESDKVDYKDIPHELNQRLYADLTQLIAKSRLFGFGAAINVADYYSCFKQDLPDEAYYFCFAENVKWCREIAQLSLVPDKVDFTFDRSFDRQYNSGQLFDELCRREEWKPYLTGRVHFVPREEECGIQAADLVARECMKRLDNQIGPKYRGLRRSMKALLDTRRFMFKYFQRPEFEAMIQNMKELRGNSIVDYQRWLSSLKLQDNHSNRIRYMALTEPIAQYAKTEVA